MARTICRIVGWTLIGWPFVAVLMFLAAYPQPGAASIVIAFFMLLATGLVSIVVGALALIFGPGPKPIAAD